MTTEVELKFLVDRDFSAELAQRLTVYTVLATSDRQLANTYFDTEERALRGWQCGLRVRTQDGQHEQTIKCAGQSIGGLHQRPEYNLPLEGEWPVLTAFPSDIWPQGVDIGALQNGLRPQFRTDFRRQAWRLKLTDGSEVELAFDQGSIEAAGRQEPLCELELELISGQTESLFTLARELLSLGGLRLSGISKAQRGYRLAGLTPEPEVQRMGFVPVNDGMSVADGLLAVFGYALTHWQYHEQLFIEQPSLAALTQLRNGVFLLQQTQQIFADLMLDLPARHWQAELSWLEGELAWLDEALALERLTDERGHYLRTLRCHDLLLDALHQQQQHLPPLTGVRQICHSPRYAALMLALNHWLFAVRQAGSSYSALASQPLRRYAQAMLDQSWRELHQGDMMAPQLDYSAYLILVGKLRRNLLVGVSFATLFDEEQQQGFRLPWLNILRRMEDLEHFEVLDGMSATLPTAAHLELGEWLTSKIEPRLIELDQARLQARDMEPYWLGDSDDASEDDLQS